MRGQRGNRNGNGNGNSHNNHNNHNNNNNQSVGLTKLFVRGWTTSNAASNPDGGVHSLEQWLEKRSQRKIVKSYRSNDAFVISVNSDDAHRFTHLNGFTFANASITVEDPSNKNSNNQPPSGPRNQLSVQNQNNNQLQNGSSRGGRGGTRGGHNNDRRSDLMQTDGDTAGADKVEAALTAVIRRCYHPGNKHLNLSELPNAPELVDIGLVSQSASKVFSAIFVCCETKVFETPLKRQQMVESLSLESNGLTSVKDCIAAAGTFNTIKNLSLRFNVISDVGELRYWRNRFPNLECLMLTGNPCDNPETWRKMRQWYPKLKIANGEAIPDIEAEQNSLVPPAATAALELIPNEMHPQVPPGSKFGQPEPGKPGDQVMREQMALRFSYETRLNLDMSIECLRSNYYEYTKALENLKDLTNQGQIQDSFMWGPRP